MSLKQSSKQTVRRLGAAALLIVLLIICNSVQRGSLEINASGSSSTAAAKSLAPVAQNYGPPVKLGHLTEEAIDESSGLAVSRTTPGLYWTHNDSGDGPFIYAFDEHGAKRGTWRVKGASARDWEDIAAGPGPQRGVSYLYIGDIGDNQSRRTDVTVYRVKEPTIKASDVSSSKARPLTTADAEAIRFRYPDGATDAETLLVHPKTGDLYIVTKVPLGSPVVYKASAPLSGTVTLKRIAELNVPSLFGLITGGDISPDGLRVALCDYTGGYELVLSNAREPFDQIWKQSLKAVSLGERKQGEAIAYRLDGRALLTTSEGPHSPLLEVVRR